MDTLVIEGELKIIDQEGGYANPTIKLDGQVVEQAIQALFIDYINAHGDSEHIPGRWRITLEQIVED